MPKFAKRLLVAAILLLVLAAILHMGGWLQCAIFTIGAIASVFEISNAFEKRDRKPFMLPAYLYAAGYFALYRLFGGEAVWLLGIFMARFDGTHLEPHAHYGGCIFCAGSARISACVFHGCGDGGGICRGV